MLSICTYQILTKRRTGQGPMPAAPPPSARVVSCSGTFGTLSLSNLTFNTPPPGCVQALKPNSPVFCAKSSRCLLGVLIFCASSFFAAPPVRLVLRNFWNTVQFDQTRGNTVIFHTTRLSKPYSQIVQFFTPNRPVDISHHPAGCPSLTAK